MILIVDDTPQIIEWLGEVVREAGYFTDYSMSSQAVLYKMARLQYSMALIDVILPGDIRGDELAQKIKALPEPFNRVPLVAMTGGGDVKNVELFVAVLHKPFLPRDLRAVIQNHADPPIKDLHQTSLTSLTSLKEEGE